MWEHREHNLSNEKKTNKIQLFFFLSNKFFCHFLKNKILDKFLFLFSFLFLDFFLNSYIFSTLSCECSIVHEIFHLFCLRSLFPSPSLSPLFPEVFFNFSCLFPLFPPRPRFLLFLILSPLSCSIFLLLPHTQEKWMLFLDRVSELARATILSFIVITVHLLKDFHSKVKGQFWL